MHRPENQTLLSVLVNKKNRGRELQLLESVSEETKLFFPLGHDDYVGERGKQEREKMF